MSINTVVHINLRGDARAALEFYQSVFGGKLAVVTYEDAHNVQNPDEARQIMWGEVVSEDGFHVMAYDVPAATAFDQGEIPYFVSVRGKSPEEITAYWDKLSAQGHRQGAAGARRLLAPLRHGHRPVRCQLGLRRRRRVHPVLALATIGHADPVRVPSNSARR